MIEDLKFQLFHQMRLLKRVQVSQETTTQKTTQHALVANFVEQQLSISRLFLLIKTLWILT